GALVRMEQIPVVKHAEWTDANGRNNLIRINGAGAPRSIPISIIKEMGYFGINDEPHARNYGEDYELVLKISEKYRLGRIWEPIYEVVRHAGGTDHSIDQSTIDRNDEAKDYMRMETVLRRIKLNKAKADN
ncbi:MAG: glycosyl transferase family 2, partial [Candidatus Marinimicrobia bacterium]|nr:glycosyl transferase family 2 [Candidatus Neomarinimicrobiota bacterium]